MLDVRGYSCPLPVLEVQKEIKSHAPQQLEVMADERCAVENITRYAATQGYQVKEEERDGMYVLTLEK